MSTATRAYKPHPHAIIIPDRVMPERPPLHRDIAFLIDQTDWWANGQGELVPLVQMSHRYKRNVYAFLLRRARRIEFSWALIHLGYGASLGGEMAIDAFESAMNEHDEFVQRVGAEQWLRERPLLLELLYQSEAHAYDGPVD